MITHPITAPRLTRRMYIKSVGSFVPKLAQKAFEKYGFSRVTLLTDWAFIAGPELSSYTQPERLKWPRKVASSTQIEDADKGRPGATLVLRVDPAHALEVQYTTAQLIERINSYFGYNAVQGIKILQAPIKSTINKPARLEKTTALPKAYKNSSLSSVEAKPDTAPRKTVTKRLNRLKNAGQPPSDEALSLALERLKATFQVTSTTSNAP